MGGKPSRGTSADKRLKSNKTKKTVKKAVGGVVRKLKK